MLCVTITGSVFSLMIKTVHIKCGCCVASSQVCDSTTPSRLVLEEVL